MTAAIYSAIPTYPAKKHAVRELLEVAGIDVSDWAFTKDGEIVENPNDNIGRNTSWSFIGGDNEPIVLCVWYNDVDWTSTPAAYRGNETDYQQQLIALAGIKRGKDGIGRLKSKIKRARDFQSAVFEAHKHGRAIKLIMVGGEQVSIEESADKASIVKVRELDTALWFVHEFDGMSGEFLIVRDVPATGKEVDVIDSTSDLLDDSLFEAFLSTLSETEQDAVIKARVGHSGFRDRLLERWGGCSVTGCALAPILIASHIKPWRSCETSAERLAVANGLLLTPNLDKLFDTGLISFDDNLRILFSTKLPDGFARMLYVDKQMKIRNNHQDIRPFLAYHREHIFVDGLSPHSQNIAA